MIRFRAAWLGLVLSVLAVIVIVVAACSTMQGSSRGGSKPATATAPTEALYSKLDAPTDAYKESQEFDLDSTVATGQGGGDGLRPKRIEVHGNDITSPRIKSRLANPAPLTSTATSELWIIQRRSTQPDDDATNDDEPGCGSLVCWPTGTETAWGTQLPVPLQHTDVSASVAGYISSVNVTQTFANPFATKIEAVYVFPLPENAAVSEFIMTIGERRIRGIIREREEAQRIYNGARAQGHVASLLTQERPNIFTQKVANIEPGRTIDVNITYYSTLAYRDGGYEWVFPMVVGPRFNPPGPVNPTGLGDGVGAVGRGNLGASGQATEVQYLRPRERTGHDISLALDIDAGVRIKSIESSSHRVEITRPTANQARVRLSSSDSIPNKDFVLRYTVAGDAVETTLVTHKDARGGYFTLMLVPPRDLSRLERGPIEMVFVLDCSGSMEGEPMRQAKAAVGKGLSCLHSGDTFQIIDFAESASKLGRYPLDASSTNVRQGRSYLNSLDAGGGTYMINGLRASLGFPHDGERLRFLAFLTDGFIGNEADVLRELNAGLGDSRVFGMGVGSAPNRYLMDEMSKMGRGAVAYVGLGDKADDVMDSFFDTISKAALTDLSIDWGGARVAEIYPSRPPDLFVGRPVIITGRYDGEFTRPITVRGRAGGKPREFTVPVSASGSTSVAAATALPQVWARMKIADLSRIAMIGVDKGEMTHAIRQTAMDYSLMSPFTAFVAVDGAMRTTGDHGVTVTQPVPVPEGVRYETTVQEGQAPRGGGM